MLKCDYAGKGIDGCNLAATCQNDTMGGYSSLVLVGMCRRGF